ncbi:MAG: METTL5 family protein [Candidatus Asgardarchaeia archaeon]
MILKKRLEIILEEVEEIKDPKLELEQYTIPARLAADIVYTAAYTYDDIIGRYVCDLGCGTGRLGIGAAVVGAKKVFCVDIDERLLKIAKYYSEKLGVSERMKFIREDVKDVELRCDTVLQNPPFGIHKRHSDILFLNKAMEISDVIYSMHVHSEKVRKFIERKVAEKGFVISNMFLLKFEIPYTFKFHRKPRYSFPVDLYRIERKS